MDVHSEHIIVGLIYILLSLFFLLNNTLALVAICRDKTMLKWPSYKVMTSMIIADNVELLGLLAGGLVTVGSTEISFYLSKVIGGVPNAFWIVNEIQGCMLAATRCSALFHVGEFLFEGYRVFIWMGVAYAYGISYLVAYLTPAVNLLYTEELYGWGYVIDDISQLVSNIELVSDALCNGGMMLIYVVITVKLCLLKYKTGANSLSQKEKMAIVQSFIVCLADCCTLITWYVFPVYLPGKWSAFACAVCWIFSSGKAISALFTSLRIKYFVGVGGILYIACIKSVREESKKIIRSLLKLKSLNAVSSASVPTNQH